VLRFGTDGVRGDADRDLTDAFVRALGRAVARVLAPDELLIGRDTRASGVRIERALGDGAADEGVTPVHLGVLPTPAIAYVAQQRARPAAIVSASHNPWTDNGVKVIGGDGRKLPDELEDAIEHELEQAQRQATSDIGAGTGEASSSDAVPADVERYVDHLLDALDGRTLEGLDVFIDCANGAAFRVAPRAFAAAGARVTVLHAEPDGRNINANCGSMHPESLRAAVRDHGAHLGLALDGDADRVVAVDEHGEVVDGDQIMAMTALDMHERGALRNDAIAITVMSNLGLRRALDAAGIGVVETPVGDRHVVAAMRRHHLALGGEQSGHIVFADRATTGDGVLTGLVVADLVCRSGRPLSALAGSMTRLPQVLVNVRLDRSVDLDDAPDVWRVVREVEAKLGDTGRIVLRTSGTEPLVRIMVEAPTEAEASAAATTIRAAVEAAFA
jgi:phosphoglucosamine mutase